MLSRRRFAVPFSRLAAIALLGLATTLVLPTVADAAKQRVSLKTTKKKRTVRGPVQVVAKTKGKPRKVTFWVDRQRHQVDFKGPHRLGGPQGSLDVNGLAPGRHKVVVRAYYGKGVRNRSVASTPLVVRTDKASTTGARKVVTRLPAAAAAAAPRGAATWDGSADLGFGPWGMIQDGRNDAQWGDSEISIVPSPAMSGHRAFKFQVDGASAANGPRAELADRFELTEGSEWWFGDVLFVPSNPNRTLGWAATQHSVMQFKNEGTGAPPLFLEIRDWGNSTSGLGVRDVDDWHPLVPLASLYDRPLAIEVRVMFSSDRSRGGYEIWIDGRRAYGPVTTQTLYPGLTSGLKLGQYGSGRGNVVYWQGTRRGTARTSVTR